MIELAAPSATAPARILIDPAAGGRLASLAIDGFDIILTRENSDGTTLQWGSYPMVPFAGRLQYGKFSFRGTDVQLPVTFPPHAIHGLAHDRPWEVEADGTLQIDFGPQTPDGGWPFGGYGVQRFATADREFTSILEVHNDRRAMPAMAGWHPWFVRPVEVDFHGPKMYKRDPENIPTGELVPMPAGPWDDTFVDIDASPVLRFVGGPTVRLTSNCDHWVYFTERDHAVCVEPQTGPANAFNRTVDNRGVAIVEPGHPLVVSMTYRW